MLVLTPGLVHVGFVVHGSAPKGLQWGVGLSLGSWAYDGRRQLRWHRQKNAAAPAHAAYGALWQPGDVVTALYDGTTGEIAFRLNGTPLGVAYTIVPATRARGLCPAVSLAPHQACALNFGNVPFEVPLPEGYIPAAQAFSAGPDYDPADRKSVV